MSNVSGKHGYIDNIEFAVRDIERSREFYGSIFNWQFTVYGPRYCEFTDGKLCGGFTTLSEPKPSGGALVILYTDNLEATRVQLEKAGATIVKSEFSFPGGRRFHFTDPDGYELAVWTDN
ncbi:VOC family protein [Salmonella enterica]|nr:VOC family protein [Salmonella enterica]EDR9226602.1 VOC family protein [Salmonella enterica subsp. enterica serovar Javiana]EGA5952162.1 VOC family protein [Escherichia coli]EBB5705220.1 VOC family protein [Salmonella enterica]EEY0826660.1 VOC family protein [Salmonella enterica]